MPVTVRIGGAGLRALLGGVKQAKADGGSVGEILDALEIRPRVTDKAGALLPYVNIHVNGGEDIRHIHSFETAVADGDVVTIFTPIAGG